MERQKREKFGGGGGGGGGIDVNRLLIVPLDRSEILHEASSAIEAVLIAPLSLSLSIYERCGAGELDLIDYYSARGMLCLL